MTLAVCDGCWVEGDGPHTCELNVTVVASDGGVWATFCVCRVDPGCSGNHNACTDRVRVEAP